MQVYALFDQLLLLSEGHVVYFGLAQEAVSYFGTLSAPALAAKALQAA